MFFFEVWVAHSFASKPYTYSFGTSLPMLSVVSIEFGSKKCFGVIITQTHAIERAKPILFLCNLTIQESFFAFILKFASYYFLKVGAVLELVFPSIAFKNSLPILLIFNEMIYSLSNLLLILPLKEIKKLCAANNVMNFVKNDCHNLSLDQKKAIFFIKNSKKICVLEGVTGSGKTIVALESALDFRNKILILVPEINLANNWLAVIKKNFGIEAFIFHSKISQILKKSIFNWVISDSCGFIIGTRSALMLPYKNLDYIIIDEEHSTFYRQDSYPYYNARDMAVLLGVSMNIKVLLLSATPSLETVLNIKKEKYDHIKLSRTPKHGLASVSYVKGRSSEILASKIIEKAMENFKKNQQVLFFLNRKGYAPYCCCNQCKYLLECNNCESTLTLYCGFKTICHKCGKKNILPKTCPSCSSLTTWSFWGIGVQKLNEFLCSLFPEYSFITVTCDSEDISSQFADIESNKVNGIIATQILAQGHDFKHIGLVVVVDADMGLISTDFRAMERMYQLWQQMRGRSGRHNIKGEMILQYFKEENRFLEVFKKEEIAGFLLKDRLEGQWPPFFKCAFIKFKGRDKDKLEKYVESIHFDCSSKVNVFGPFFFGMQNKIFEFRFLVKAPNYAVLKQFLQVVECSFKKCEIEID